MSYRTQIGLGIVGAALMLGALGDTLLRATPWGINVLLWALAFMTVVLILSRRYALTLSQSGRWFMVPALLFAAAFAWRDSLTLQTLDGLAFIGALFLALRGPLYRQLQRAGIVEYAWLILLAGLNALFGFVPLLVSDIEWERVPCGKWDRQLAAVGRGLLIAVPLVLLFGALFAAADAVFAHLVSTAFHLDMAELAMHLLVMALIALAVCGLLRGAFLREERAAGEDFRSQLLSVGSVETGTVLGLLDLLFLAFVLVQLRYFFGGQEVVRSTIGLTYAQYARRGFFELVTVAALVLPLLLLMHWLLRKDTPKAEILFRVLAGAQIALLFVIMASALQRMRLYESAYGLTELRLYTTVFMGWLALLFLWFAATVLRYERDRFAFGALVSAFVVIGVMHLLNPDACIARANVHQAAIGHAFDVDYVTSLSADAVPALMDALPLLPAQQREAVQSKLSRGWRSGRRPDWRTWNWARAQAARCANRIRY